MKWILEIEMIGKYKYINTWEIFGAKVHIRVREKLCNINDTQEPKHPTVKEGR